MMTISTINNIKSACKRILDIDIPTQTVSCLCKDQKYVFHLNTCQNFRVNERFLTKIGLRWYIEAHHQEFGSIIFDMTNNYRKLPQKLDMWREVLGEKLSYDENLYHMTYRDFFFKVVGGWLGR